MTRDEQFFYEHAGYSYDPKTETAEQGRKRCARELARAEHYAYNLGWTVEWREDWEVGSHREFYGEDSAYAEREPESCEMARLQDAESNTLASLGCIDDADSNYRRVIFAELASEALAAYDREVETLDAH